MVVPPQFVVSNLPDLSQEPLASLVLLSGLLTSGQSLFGVVSDLSSRKNEETVSAKPKDLESEQECLQAKLGFVQIAAMKALCVLLSNSKYVDPLVFHSFGGESAGDTSKFALVMRAMHLIVRKAISPAPIARHVPVSELDRACGILVKCIISSELGIPVEDQTDPLEGSPLAEAINATDHERASVGDEETSPVGVRSPSDERPTALRRLQRARARLQLLRARRHEALERESSSGSLLRERAEEEVLRVSRLRIGREERPPIPLPGSSSASSPQLSPLQSQLLEMGFPLPHINRALSSLGSRFSSSSAQQTADARVVNRLVTWMIDHPLTDSDIIEAERREQEAADSTGPPAPILTRPRTLRRRLEVVPGRGTSLLQRLVAIQQRSDEAGSSRSHEEESAGDDSDSSDPFLGMLYSEDEVGCMKCCFI